MAESNGKSDREAELDRKIAEIRRKNEELIKRKQEVDNDKYEASKVEGGAVSLSSGGPAGGDRDNFQVPITNVRERLGKGRVQDSESGLSDANSQHDLQQRQYKPQRSRDENWRQERDKPDKERLQRPRNDGGEKYKPNSRTSMQQPRRPSDDDEKGRLTKGSSKNTYIHPAANQKANRPANQQYERSPRQESLPEDSKHANQQRTVTAQGDQIVISVSASEKSNSPTNKSIKSRLGPRVEESQPTANTKSKPEKGKQSQKRTEQSIKLHVLPLNDDHKVTSVEEKQRPIADMTSKTTTQSDDVVEDTEQWEDVDEENDESNNDDTLSPNKSDKDIDNDIDAKVAGSRKVRTDTFDRIQQEMIDKLTENVDAVEALMAESDEDIDELLEGKHGAFSRRFDREQKSDGDVAERVGDVAKGVSD